MGSFVQLWDKLRDLAQTDYEKVAIITRHIWLRQNEFIFNDKLASPEQTNLLALQVHELFLLLQENNLDSSTTIPISKVK